MAARKGRLPGSWPGAWAKKQRPPLDIYPLPVQLKQHQPTKKQQQYSLSCCKSSSSSSSCCGSTKQSLGKQPSNVIKK